MVIRQMLVQDLSAWLNIAIIVFSSVIWSRPFREEYVGFFINWLYVSARSALICNAEWKALHSWNCVSVVTKSFLMSC
jgi:hypothetical protein